MGWGPVVYPGPPVGLGSRSALPARLPQEMGMSRVETPARTIPRGPRRFNTFSSLRHRDFFFALGQQPLPRLR